MLDQSLNLQGSWHIDLGHVGAQVSDLFGIYHTELGLNFSQGHPQLAPQQTFIGFAPQAAHGRSAVPPSKGGEIGIKIIHQASHKIRMILFYIWIGDLG